MIWHSGHNTDGLCESWLLTAGSEGVFHCVCYCLQLQSANAEYQHLLSLLEVYISMKLSSWRPISRQELVDNVNRSGTPILHSHNTTAPSRQSSLSSNMRRPNPSFTPPSPSGLSQLDTSQLTRTLYLSLTFSSDTAVTANNDSEALALSSSPSASNATQPQNDPIPLPVLLLASTPSSFATALQNNDVAAQSLAVTTVEQTCKSRESFNAVFGCLYWGYLELDPVREAQANGRADLLCVTIDSILLAEKIEAGSVVDLLCRELQMEFGDVILTKEQIGKLMGGGMVCEEFLLGWTWEFADSGELKSNDVVRAHQDAVRVAMEQVPGFKDFIGKVAQRYEGTAVHELFAEEPGWEVERRGVRIDLGKNMEREASVRLSSESERENQKATRARRKLENEQGNGDDTVREGGSVSGRTRGSKKRTLDEMDVIEDVPVGDEVESAAPTEGSTSARPKLTLKSSAGTPEL